MAELTLEELAVMAAVNRPMPMKDIAGIATDFFSSPRFDRVVAVATVQSLVARGYLERRPGSQVVSPTQTGLAAANQTLQAVRVLEMALRR